MHLSQIFFTDARTFMKFLTSCEKLLRLFWTPGPKPWTLLVAVNDAAAVQVVRAELDGNSVAGEDADEVLAHAA